MKSEQRQFLILSGFLIAGAVALRLYRIGDAEVWMDEAFSFYAATVKTDLARILLTENNPPLYYVLLRLWVKIAGTSEAALRLPSAIFGTLFVATVIWVGTTWFNRRVGLWAGAFAAVAPIHIYYSQEARSYVLLGFLLLLTYGLLWRALDRDTWPAWMMASLAAALAVYTHYLAVLGLLPTVVLVAIHRNAEDKRIWQRYGTSIAACVLLLLPWVVWSFAMPDRSLVGADWVKAFWERTPPALAIPKSLEVLGLGSQAGYFPPLMKVYSLVVFPLWLRLMGIVLFLMLGLWVAVPWMDRHLRIPDISRRKACLWAMLLFPLIAMSLISFFFKPIYIVGRYDFLAFPAYSLLVGLGLAKLQATARNGLWLAIGLAVALCVPIGDKLLRYYEASSTTNGSANSARLVSRTLFQQAQEGDVAVFTGLRGISVIYYLDQLGVTWSEKVCRQRTTGRQFGCRLYPRENEDHPAVHDARRVLAAPSEALEDVKDLVAGLQTPTGRLWLAFGHVTYASSKNDDAPQLMLQPEDALLLEALQRMGFSFNPSRALGAWLLVGTQSSAG